MVNAIFISARSTIVFLKPISYIYIVRWDRFSRNVEQAYVEISRLKALGVEIKCLEETISPNDLAFDLFRALKIGEGQMVAGRQFLQKFIIN